MEWASEMDIDMPSFCFENIILQNFESDNRYVVHLLILIYKYMVFRNKEKHNDNNMYNYKAKINYIENVERKIAMKNQKIAIHLKKWSAILGNV